jgi:hypothetical protein
MTKLASATPYEPLEAPRRPRDTSLYMDQCLKAKLASERVLTNIKMALLNSKDELDVKLRCVRDWCRKNASQVPEVEWNSRQLFGSGAKELFDLTTLGLTGIGRAEKRAYATRNPIDQTKAPYSLVKAALDKAVEYIRDESYAKEASSKIVLEVAKALPFGQKEAELSQVLGTASLTAKEAAGFWGSMFSGAAGGMAQHALQPKSPGDISAGMQEDISDPAHEAQMRAIKSQAMLSDLMANDEIISGHDPATVTNAYNEIVQLNPHISAHYGIMRGALRKHLASGDMQPFDVEQLRKIDQSFAPHQGGM